MAKELTAECAFPRPAAGLVITCLRPGTAAGTVCVTLEDETGTVAPLPLILPAPPIG